MATSSSSQDKQYKSELFIESDPNVTVGVKDMGGLAKFLKPAGTGGVDVVNNYRWTMTELNGRYDTPAATLTEFRILQSSFLNSARYFLQGVDQQVVSTNSIYRDRMQGYAGLVDFTNPTGFSYYLPYFSDVSNEVQSSWTALDFIEKLKGAANFLSPGAAELGETAVKAYMFKQELAYPRVGVMDRPKLWESSTPRTINIKFPLFNTWEEKDIKNNWDLCYLLLYQNMFNKRDFITAIPPVFYTVHIPGQFFSIAMYVSDLKIYNRGNIRMMQVGGRSRNIPDVYEVDMSLTDMVMPSQNMMAELLNEQPVQVVKRDPKTGEYKDALSPGTPIDTAVRAGANAAGVLGGRAGETLADVNAFLLKPFGYNGN